MGAGVSCDKIQSLSHPYFASRAMAMGNLNLLRKMSRTPETGSVKEKQVDPTLVAHCLLDNPAYCTWQSWLSFNSPHYITLLVPLSG